MRSNQPRMPEIFEDDDKKKRPATVTILKPLSETYSFFRDFSYFARVMPSVGRVEEGETGSHRWHARDEETSWDTELMVENPPHRIAWRTKGAGSLEMVGAVTFEPALGGRATEVRLKLLFPSHSGGLAGLVRKLKGEDPDTETLKSLRQLKALLETGEIPTTQGQPDGREETAAA